jgi:ectoine hydroxylase-related dioxygenase (phytanoyl-CoA dioxygenase family)
MNDMEISATDAIATKGFCHLPNFLDKQEIAKVKQIFYEASPSKNVNYPNKSFVDCSVFGASVLEKIHALSKQVFPNDELILHGAVAFSIVKNDPEKSINLGFHQDYESYFIFNEHSHYLNFWIALDKDDVENSNLTVVPFDALQLANPIVYEILRGSGATRIEDNLVIKNDSGGRYKLDFDLNDIAITPKMRSGDLLLLRGDVVHKTQNQNANRIAISIRAIKKTAVINRRSFFRPSRGQLHFMANNLESYALIDFIFSEKGVDFMTAEKLINSRIEFSSKITGLTAATEIKEKFQGHVQKFKRSLLLADEFSTQLNEHWTNAIVG